MFWLFDYSKENIAKYNFIHLCYLLAKFHIHKQKSVSNPVFSLFRVDLDKYMETIQSSVNPKAIKTISIFIPCVVNVLLSLFVNLATHLFRKNHGFTKKLPL